MLRQLTLRARLEGALLANPFSVVDALRFDERGAGQAGAVRPVLDIDLCSSCAVGLHHAAGDLFASSVHLQRDFTAAADGRREGRVVNGHLELLLETPRAVIVVAGKLSQVLWLVLVFARDAGLHRRGRASIWRQVGVAHFCGCYIKIRRFLN